MTRKLHDSIDGAKQFMRIEKKEKQKKTELPRKSKSKTKNHY